MKNLDSEEASAESIDSELYNIDHAKLTTEALKKNNFIRQPDAASPDRFLKCREGNGGWAKGKCIQELDSIGRAKKMTEVDMESKRLKDCNLMYTADGDLVRKRRPFASQGSERLLQFC